MTPRENISAVIPVSAQRKTGTHRLEQRRNLRGDDAEDLHAIQGRMGPGLSRAAKTGMTALSGERALRQLVAVLRPGLAFGGDDAAAGEVDHVGQHRAGGGRVEA